MKLKTILLALATLAIGAATASAAAVNLVADKTTLPVTLANGETVTVPGWGFGLGAACGAPVSVPGPRITIPAGDTSLTINLVNCLPEPVSIVVPGLLPTGATAGNVVRQTDAVGRSRVRSMTPETPAGGSHSYTFSAKPGTYLYQSGTNPAVQVQMGLYGAVTENAIDAATGVDAQAYAGKAYKHDELLLFSEIDVRLHQTVDAGTFGTDALPSAIDYKTNYFLINGQSYAGQTPDLAGGVGEPTLLRLLNAGLNSHAVLIDGETLNVVAEDGNAVPFARSQSSVLLAAGKTHDALWQPLVERDYSAYDRTLRLEADAQAFGGMLAKLHVGPATGGSGGGGSGQPPVAHNDAFSGAIENTSFSGPSVLTNDTSAGPMLAPVLVGQASAGAVILNADGTFSYTPIPHFAGVDQFSYRAQNANGLSNIATVMISIANVADRPIATPGALTLNVKEIRSTTVAGTDYDHLAMSFYLTNLPTAAGSKAAVIDPATKVRTDLTSANLYGGASPIALPGGVVWYEAGATPGSDTIGFCVVTSAFKTTAQCTSSPQNATIGITVRAVTTTATCNGINEREWQCLPSGRIPLTVAAVNPQTGETAPVTSFRWTLQEDRTYRVVPGVIDPDTISLRFHQSYMPVIASGDENDLATLGGLPNDPSRRYFVSVLPPDQSFFNGGSPIAAGQSAVTVNLTTGPVPTAQIRIRVFLDDHPLNAQWDDEDPLPNFQVKVVEAAGRYGQAGGLVTKNAFGDPIGTTYRRCTATEVNAALALGPVNGPADPCWPTPTNPDPLVTEKQGDGFVLTDSQGIATIADLDPGKYDIFVVPPVNDAGGRWIQTSTLEGTKGVEAFIKNNEPNYFQEFGPAGPHVEIGFIQEMSGALQNPLGLGTGSVKGQVVQLRQSAPPFYQPWPGAPLDHFAEGCGQGTGSNWDPTTGGYNCGNWEESRSWVGLNDGTSGTMLYAAPTDAEGNFEIKNIPAGNYTLSVFDSELEFIMDNRSLVVCPGYPATPCAGGTTDLGKIAEYEWLTRVFNYVYEDPDGTADPTPYIGGGSYRGIPDMAVNLRFRDGTLEFSGTTNDQGFVAFNEAFPYFNWQVLEVDGSKYQATGLAAIVDAGGCSQAPGCTPNGDWSGIATKLGLDPSLMNPMPVAADERGSSDRVRLEPGPVFTEGFQAITGATSAVFWGKRAYQGTSPRTTADWVAVDTAHPDWVEKRCDIDQSNPDCTPEMIAKHDFPSGVGDALSLKWNGGITGIVSFDTTRAENDPRWGTMEPWQPGVPFVKMELWDATRTIKLNETITDRWDEEQPAGCYPANGDPVNYKFLGKQLDCFDGLRNYEQVRPGVYDGAFAFFTVTSCTATGAPDYTSCAANVSPEDQYQARTFRRPLPAGKYVVKMVVPPGYHVVREEDKNVDFGPEYIPEQFYQTGNTFGDGGATGANPPQVQPTKVDENITAPFCVGAAHKVPDTLSLFPGVQTGAWAGATTPLCDEKAVRLNDAFNAGVNFFLSTDSHVGGQIIGFVLDDLTNESDPNNPQFGEKYAPPFLPVSIKDWNGNEINHVYTDRFGVYNAMVPSMFDIAPPIPSGVTPNVLQVCINSPTTTFDPSTGRPLGTTAPDPWFDKRYTQFCYTSFFMPGATTYLDTPVTPTGSFTGPQNATVDVEAADQTPVIKAVFQGLMASTSAGPYVVLPAILPNSPAGQLARTITIQSMGSETVPNPEFRGWASCPPSSPTCSNGVDSTSKRTITRDHGFGTIVGQVFLDTLDPTTHAVVSSTALTEGLTWSNDTITVRVPNSATYGEIRVVRPVSASPQMPNRTARGVTLTVVTALGDAGMRAANRVKTVPGDYKTIQAAVDNTRSGGLILVAPGTYQEQVVMDHPVRLQGWGAPSTIINGAKSPTEQLQAWRLRVASTINSAANANYLTPFQQAELALGTDAEGELISPILGGEAAGVTVLARNVPVITSPLVGTSGCPQDSVRAVARTAAALADDSAPRLVGYGLATIGGLFGTLARIDGFTITGVDTDAGVDVNAFACNLEIMNNRIFSNQGDWAGGIKLGHPNAPVELALDQTYNSYIGIQYNAVIQNSSLSDTGAGGIGIGGGSDHYAIRDNFISGNFSSGLGAGIAHVGLSDRGVIDHNTIAFNEAFSQSVTTGGGGIFIGGFNEDPAGITAGSGNVVISNNVIQGNSASGGDGGGIDVEYVNGQDVSASTSSTNWWRIGIYGNMIVNNEAALAGGGVSLRDAVRVEVFNNTVVDNDSLATAGAAFTVSLTPPTNNLWVSADQPAGIATYSHSAALQGVLPGSSAHYSNPRIVNSIVWHNRSFHFGPVAGTCNDGGQGTGGGGVCDPLDFTNVTAYGLINCSSPACVAFGSFKSWDLGMPGQSSPNGGGLFTQVTYSDLTSTTGLGGTNTAASPSFRTPYQNGSGQAWLTDPGFAAIPQVAAAFDEGGNFIRPNFFPLTLTNPTNPLQPTGDYHLTGGLPGQVLYSGQVTGQTGIYASQTALNDINNGAPALTTDLDADFRNTSGVYPTIGADQAAPALPVLTLSGSGAFGNQTVNSTSSPLIINVGNSGNANLSITGISVTGANANQFSVQSNNCPAQLPAGSNCQVGVVFTPTSTGNKTASLSVTVGAPATNGSVTLTGTGVNPTASLTALAFGSVIVNASVTQAMTVTVGQGPATITGFTRTAGTMFVLSNTAGTCGAVNVTGGGSGATLVAPVTLAAGQSCTFNVTFTPTSTGVKAGTFNASLSVGTSSGAAVGGTGIQGTAAYSSATLGTLSGTGTRTLAFGNLSGGVSSTVTVTVGGTAPVTFGTAVLTNTTGAEFSLGANTCSGATIAVGSTCTIQVNFNAPATNSTRAATLSLPDNAASSPQVLNLTGS